MFIFCRCNFHIYLFFFFFIQFLFILIRCLLWDVFTGMSIPISFSKNNEIILIGSYSFKLIPIAVIYYYSHLFNGIIRERKKRGKKIVTLKIWQFSILNGYIQYFTKKYAIVPLPQLFPPMKKFLFVILWYYHVSFI